MGKLFSLLVMFALFEYRSTTILGPLAFTLVGSKSPNIRHILSDTIGASKSSISQNSNHHFVHHKLGRYLFSLSMNDYGMTNNFYFPSTNLMYYNMKHLHGYLLLNALPGTRGSL